MSQTESKAIVAASAAVGAALGAIIAWKIAKKPYTPPKVWAAPKPGGSKFASINAPTAGAREVKALPKGKHPLQLYSLGTPNGVKVTICLEELCDLLPNFEYDAWLTMISGEQFGSEFVAVNPNSKIPALLDTSTDTRVFESGAILLYLCDKYDAAGALLPREPLARAEVVCWLMWQMASAPYVGGGFGHFYNYANVKNQYAIDRFTMETKRQLDVLEKQLAGDAKSGGPRRYICGDQYTVADMAIYPWYGKIVQGKLYGAAEFLSVSDYPQVARWCETMAARPAVQRGNMVNRTWGTKEEQLKNRHSRADFPGHMYPKK